MLPPLALNYLATLPSSITINTSKSLYLTQKSHHIIFPSSHGTTALSSWFFLSFQKGSPYFLAPTLTTHQEFKYIYIFLYLFLSNMFGYLFFFPSHSPPIIIHSERLLLSSRHPTTWGSCFQSLAHMLIRLLFEKLASSWYYNLLPFPPFSTSHDALKHHPHP